MFYVYIIKDKNANKIYTGFSRDLKTRIKNHTDKTVKTTKNGNYELIFYSAFQDKNKALSFEKYLKQGSGYAFARKRLI